MLSTRLGTIYGQGFPLTLVQYTDLIVLSAAEIRSLKSVPVTLVTAPGQNKLIVPNVVQLYLKAGTSAFSASLNITIKTDGGAGQAGFGPIGDFSTSVATALSGTEQSWLSGVLTTSYLNKAMLITASADVTGGDGTLFVIVTYQVIDVTGMF